MRTLAYCLICLPLARLHVTSSFGYRHHPLTGRMAFHNGIDFRARSDTVYAMADGVASSVAYDVVTGMHIGIKHGDFDSLYGHLSQVFISEADTILAGQAIGITGKTGRATGEHLHFSIRAAGRWVDPLEFIYHLINNKNHE